MFTAFLSDNNVIATDQYFSSVTLLVHMNGIGGSSTFTDSSAYHRTINKIGSPIVSITKSKFGGASANIPLTTSALTTPNSSTLAFAKADSFTIEGWMYLTSTGTNVLFANYAWSGATQNSNIAVWTNASSNAVEFACYQTNSIIQYCTSTNTVPLNTWTHVGGCYDGTKMYAMCNGSVNTVTCTLASFMTYASFAHYIGAYGIYGGGSGGQSGQPVGYIDEIRVTKGVARYTSNYTVPTAPFPNK